MIRIFNRRLAYFLVVLFKVCAGLNIPSEKKFYWLPNALTVSRLVTVPVVTTSILAEHTFVAQTCLALSGATDWFDGYIARRLGVESKFGAFLDPVVDKICVVTTCLALTIRYGTIIGIPTMFLISREIAISALREWAAQQNKRDLVAVNSTGKVKTTVQFCALFLLAGEKTLSIFSLGLFYLATVLTLYSGSLLFYNASSLFRQ
mmetsp:Transcript_11968/g.17941  ORF Transcript_11968/g.17941 Transcript_11968/m.17941 type:complete len:205 (+) Transcript_11968:878-1492(+)